jgi:thioredoxin reductase
MRRGEEIALKVNLSARAVLLRRLADQERITILTEIQYKEINPTGVVITNKDGKEQIIAADTVILAVGAKPNTELLSSIKDMIGEVYPVGDCVEPRNIMEAMTDGYRAGLAI